MSEIKVNKISPRTNCGTTTLGDSGDSFVIPSGVTITNNGTQTGFGREGSVDWQTSSIKTTTFTATSGEGYFVDTSSGAVTCNLPAGSAGAIVAFADYTRTFNSNNLTISPNGSNKIGGISADAKLTVAGQSATFVFVDSTEGWINVQETQSSQTGAVDFLAATGGTVTTSGDFKIHTFTSPGTFCVSQISTVDTARNTLGYMVVAGGGGAANSGAGGGGAGGYREGRNTPIDNFTASPLVANAPTNAVTITSAGGVPVTVGAGGTAAPVPTCANGGDGSASVFSTITSTGGGGGAQRGGSGNPGGSGGGWGGSSGGHGDFGDGNTPPVSPAQGNNGGGPPGPGSAAICAGTGGGGATAGGSGWPGSRGVGTNGGAGATSSITGSPVARAGGGGGGARTSPGPGSAGSGGTGGGGAGANGPGPCTSTPGTSGTVNTGGGGGGTGTNSPGGAGGSGIVVIRYKFQ